MIEKVQESHLYMWLKEKDSKKLRDLGWNGKYSLRDGLAETLECMRRK